MIVFVLWEGVFSDFQEYFLRWNYFYGDGHFLEYYSSCLFYFALFFWVWSIKSGGCLLLAASSELSLLLAASYYASHRSFGLVSNTYVCSQQSERERKKRVSYLSLLRFQIIPILQPSCTVEGDGGKRLHSPCTARAGVPALTFSLFPFHLAVTRRRVHVVVVAVAVVQTPPPPQASPSEPAKSLSRFLRELGQRKKVAGFCPPFINNYKK